MTIMHETDVDYESRTTATSKTAQGIILLVLGLMFAIPGSMLIMYGAHLLNKSVEETGESSVNVAIVLGPILLLAGVVVLIAGLLTCTSLNCRRAEDDGRPIFSVDSEADLHIPQNDGEEYGDGQWQGSGLPSDEPLELAQATDFALVHDGSSPTFKEHRMVLRVEPMT